MSSIEQKEAVETALSRAFLDPTPKVHSPLLLFKQNDIVFVQSQSTSSPLPASVVGSIDSVRNTSCVCVWTDEQNEEPASEREIEQAQRALGQPRRTRNIVRFSRDADLFRLNFLLSADLCFLRPLGSPSSSPTRSHRLTLAIPRGAAPRIDVSHRTKKICIHGNFDANGTQDNDNGNFRCLSLSFYTCLPSFCLSQHPFLTVLSMHTLRNFYR